MGSTSKPRGTKRIPEKGLRFTPGRGDFLVSPTPTDEGFYLSIKTGAEFLALRMRPVSPGCFHVEAVPLEEMTDLRSQRRAKR